MGSDSVKRARQRGKWLQAQLAAYIPVVISLKECTTALEKHVLADATSHKLDTEESEHEAFWELIGFGVVGTLKLSELGARAIPGGVTHWEVARELPKTKPCGQREGPKTDNIVLQRSRSRGVTIWYQSYSAVWRECADEDVGPLRGGGLNSEIKRVGARAIPGGVTHWEVARELPETKSCRQRGGPKANNIVLRRSRSRGVTPVLTKLHRERCFLSLLV
ncbi:hypothetical protein L3X38_020207 [Prunus dulcis]|uniref:Uncharacterized protein n=1 Tax=Prunus dulcis TaxID=3755 RepID=A0AAD4WDD7_PRUDU|nr:hypothetical protein L3X38_020207 [Prunus dulcis]